MPPAEAAAASAQRWRFEAIGTVWEIETEKGLADGIRAEVLSAIDRFDREWSRFRPDSLVSALARGAESVPVPPDASAMLDLYAELSDATDGGINPLVGGSLERLGYDADYSLRATEPVRAPDDWRSTLTWTPDRLSLTVPATIDVGALGKGRLVDVVLEILDERLPVGVLVVDAGGDIAVRGGPVRIGLEHPYDARRAIGVVELTDAALCASATNRRAWGDGLHHVLDARTGMPVRTVAATWALASDAMRADAIATALFFEGGPALAGRWGVHWVRMLTDGRAEVSRGCPAELFTR